MRSTLALVVGTNVQAFDATLSALAAYNTNGLLTQTAADTFTGRTITGTTDKVTVTNGDGVAGNPTLTISATYVGQSSITTLGTLATGTWQATKIGLAYGGTNADLSATSGYLKQATSGANVVPPKSNCKPSNGERACGISRPSWSMTGPRACCFAEKSACGSLPDRVRRGDMISASFMAITW